MHDIYDMLSIRNIHVKVQLLVPQTSRRLVELISKYKLKIQIQNFLPLIYRMTHAAAETMQLVCYTMQKHALTLTHMRATPVGK